MARLLQSLRRFLGSPSKPPTPVPKYPRSVDTDFSFFREGDRAIIHGKNPILTKPLRHGHKTDLRRGSLAHDTIIGQRVRDRIQAHKGPDCRLTLPTLDEYVALTPRLVTPIYAADANLIVSLLDIHVAPPAETDGAQAPLEILESGTGHGSLTLHLARAIQAANANPPSRPRHSQIQYLQGRPTRPDEAQEEKTAVPEDNQSPRPNTTTADKTDVVDPPQQEWDAWRAQRRAIIHTVDVSPKFSAHAEKIVHGFRRGIYAGNVDFYVGHVENWISDQIKRRQNSSCTGFLTTTNAVVEPFLSYAILDMPSAHLRIPHVAPIMRRDGVLAVFMPSITQIGDCVDLIRRQSLPFTLDRVVELGPGISSGRLWDVRFAVKKSRADPSSWTESSETGALGEREPTVESEGENMSGPEEPPKGDDSVLVCRPKVGSRIVGGGFVGIWRRIEDFQKH